MKKRTIYVVLDDEGRDGFLFGRESDALEFAKQDSSKVEERTVWGSSPPTWSTFARGGEVYPDGTFTEWSQVYQQRGECRLPPVEQGLNGDLRYWDGHTQGHCGEHIYVTGADKDAVEQCFQDTLKVIRERQTGKCQSQHHQHRGDVDGEHVFQSDFREAREAMTGEKLTLKCFPFREHEFSEWSEWARVDSHNKSRQRSCKRCGQSQIELTYSFVSEDTRKPARAR